VIPDMKAIVVPYLNAAAPLVALEARAATKPPSTMTRPWIRVT
jgi:hypothetical protein